MNPANDFRYAFRQLIKWSGFGGHVINSREALIGILRRPIPSKPFDTNNHMPQLG